MVTATISRYKVGGLFVYKAVFKVIFEISGTIWHVVFKNPSDGQLERSDGTISVGVTDRNTRCIYLSSALQGKFLRKVLIHEVCHAICMTYDLYMPIEQEEYLCDFVATYGDQVFDIVDGMINAIRRSA